MNPSNMTTHIPLLSEAMMAVGTTIRLLPSVEVVVPQEGPLVSKRFTAERAYDSCSTVVLQPHFIAILQYKDTRALAETINLHI